jgi:ArsR family transcriptional regulator
VFKALADPTRLLILALVAKNEGGVCECNIVDCTPLSQPTISYHVKVLREAGLLDCEKRGLWCYYALRKGVLRQAAAALEEMGRVAKNEGLALRQPQGERISVPAHGEPVEP